MTAAKPGGTEDPGAEPVSGEATVLQTLAR